MDNLLYFLIGVVGILASGLLWKLFQDGRLPSQNIDTAKIREETQNEIENTPAGDLVDAAPNAKELRADATGIAEQAKQRLRDRAGEIISRLNNNGNP